MNLISFGISIVLLAAIFFISRTKYFLLAAILANFPLLSLFTYSLSKEPKHTALYLSAFSFIVSLSFLFIYFFGCGNKYINIGLIVLIWSVLSVSAFLVLKHIGVR